MTAPINPLDSPIQPWNRTPGCNGCGDPRTVLIHPRDGRLCPDCITVPAGSYRPTLATDCVDLGRVDAAFGYLRAWLAREVEYRFTAARWHHAARLIGLELRHIHGEA